MWLFADEIIWERNGQNQFRPTLRQGTLAGLGKARAGAAAAAANMARVAAALELIRAAGRAQLDQATGVWTYQSGTATKQINPGAMDFAQMDDVLREESKVRSEYIPALVNEARVYGIGTTDDVSAYPVQLLTDFYNRIVGMRKALIQDAAQYGLGPNLALPEPDRYIRLAEAVIQARDAAARAAVAPPTPTPVPAPPPPSIAAPAAPPPELLAVGPARFVAPREPSVEEYMAAEREERPARRPLAPPAFAPPLPWWQTPPAIIGGVLLLFGGAYILVRAGRR